MFLAARLPVADQLVYGECFDVEAKTALVDDDSLVDGLAAPTGWWLTGALAHRC